MNERKVLETETHIYFMNGPFSNWYPSVFYGKLDPGGPDMRFANGEQYMMAGKAHLFGDLETLAKIMATSDAKKQKELGRQVKGFDPDVWNRKAKGIVFRGCWYKACGCSDYMSALIRSESKVLVEGAAYDPVWGVGIAWNDPAILDQTNWKGTNWLGEVHMEVRANLFELLRLQSEKPSIDVNLDLWSKTFYEDWRAEGIPVYTDYPIVELGDKSGKIAPVRCFQFMSYDGDKYAVVKAKDSKIGLLSMKLCYLYSMAGRCGEVPVFDPDTAENM